ncbi:MAG: superoxide dismutase family protein [Lachnospiraceae bacterium]|jgi:Cu-Zn family superoxide dismutase|nr:superoxide dismutase family protein [Lachnospiraceae bacterium]
MYQFTPRLTFVRILEKNRPAAVAWVTGNNIYSELSGLVKFYDTPYDGVLIEAEVFGLPNVSTQGSSDFYAMHIHQYGNCSGSFEKTGSHFNPTNAFHPEHAGDMIPLLGNQGYAWTSFYDKRFTIDDIIGKSVVIHSKRDDFTTQPAGDSGEKIGCGIIRKED